MYESINVTSNRTTAFSKPAVTSEEVYDKILDLQDKVLIFIIFSGALFVIRVPTQG